ncbi:MAG TPA: quinoprotein dehydrogenase-associated putative ABC transporter substrate-binding protein [Gemmatimonadales bacterium]|nr:quinoprotein dehydrogenase-associated putative ABC transporter substrate-binding protein [Gemmatimonadales bacterium]
MGMRAFAVPLVVLALAGAEPSQHQPAPGAAARVVPPAGPRVLRVCADPDNMPFSNRRLEGFENRIVALVARDMGASVAYTWWPEQRGFLRHTLNAHACDVVPGISAGDSRLLTTAPYFRSTYVFVYRADRGYHINSFDNPALRRLRIGVHVIGDDYNSLPPGVALARRGLASQVVGFSMYGNSTKDAAADPGDAASADPERSAPSVLIRAVARGDIDVAVAWGPLAGYYAARDGARSGHRLRVVPVQGADAGPAGRFVYAIAMGARRGDSTLVAQVDRALAHRRGEIHRILRRYHVPLVGDSARVAAAGPCAHGAEVAKTAEAVCE